MSESHQIDEQKQKVPPLEIYKKTVKDSLIISDVNMHNFDVAGMLFYYFIYLPI